MQGSEGEVRRSRFYINYLIVGWFTLALATLRISLFIKFVLFRQLGWSKEEARARAEHEQERNPRIRSATALVLAWRLHRT